MILVIGATGLLGMEVCRGLKQRGKAVRAMVRSTTSEKAMELVSAGVELVVADLKHPGSLQQACNGASAVVSTASSTLSRQSGDSIETVDRLGQKNAIAAARSAGVGHFVFVSIPSAIRFPSPLSEAKKEVEQHLAASGVPYTILNANYFMEVWLSPALGFDYKNRKVTLYGTGENPISFISYHDVAKFAVEALDSAAVRNRAIDICGPERISQLDAVRIFERAANCTFDRQHVPENTLRANRENATDPMDQTFASLILDYAAGNVADPAASLQFAPIRLKTVMEYASQTATVAAH